MKKRHLLYTAGISLVALGVTLTITPGSMGLDAFNVFKNMRRSVSGDYSIGMNADNKLTASEVNGSFVRKTGLNNDVEFAASNATAGSGDYFVTLGTQGSYIKNTQSILGITEISLDAVLEEGTEYKVKYQHENLVDFETEVVTSSTTTIDLAYPANYFTIELVKGSAHFKSIDIKLSCEEFDESKVIYIKTADDFNTFRAHIETYTYATLCNDINLGSTVFGTKVKDGTVEANIGTFNGTFNGKGHKFTGGYFGTYGLFGDIGVDGVVENVQFTDCELEGVQSIQTSIIAGRVKGTVRNILIDTDYLALLNSSNAGGASGTAICHNLEATATLENIVVYWNILPRKRWSSGTSDIGYTGAKTITGVGTASASATVKNIYSFSLSSESKGDQATRDANTALKAKMNVLLYTATCAEAGLTTATGFDDIWDFNATKARMKINKITIKNLTDFQTFRSNIASYDYAELANDISLGSTVFGTNKKDGAVEECIGTFNGIFNGKGHKFTGGYFGTYGLFGDIGVDGVVENVQFTNCELEGVQSIQTSIIAGRVKGTVKNVLIDTKYQALLNSSNAGGASGTAICHNLESTATLENIIVYWNVLPRKKWSSGVSDIHYTTAKTITGVGTASATATVKNIYSFSMYNESTGDQATKDANTELKAIMNVLLYSATCEEAGLTSAEGFDPTIWDFSSTKAALK